MKFGFKRGAHDKRAVIYAALTLAAVLPYLNTLAAGFAFDDDHQIVGNPYVRSFHYIKQILFTPVWSFKYAKVPTNYYRPLMPLQYLLLYQIYGPLSYVFHLANVLLHAGVVILLFMLAARLFKSEALAFLSALLFAVHTIHTEVVAWVAAVPDLQLALFLMVTFWFYLDLREPEKRRWWTPVLAYGAFFFALYSKEPAAAFPVLMMVFEHFLAPDRESFTAWGKAKRYIPLWGLMVVYLISRVLFIGGIVPRVERARLPWGTTLRSSVSLFGQYMNKLVWPSELSIFHTVRFTWSVRDPDFLAGAGWLLAAALLALVLWKWNRVQLLSVLWVGAFLAPALNVRWMPGTVFSERYLYVPSVGFCWLVAFGTLKLWGYLAKQRWTVLRPVAATLGVAIIALLARSTYARNKAWVDDFTLFSAAVRMDPDNADVRADLGIALWHKERIADAIRQWEIGYSINPKSFWILDDLGMARVYQKRYPEGIKLLRQSIALCPPLTSGHVHLAQAYEETGDNPDAEAQYRLAIENSPLNADAHNRYGDFLVKNGRLDAARDQYSESLDADPTTQALDGLGDIALDRAQTHLAESYFRRAADFDTYDYHAHFELVILYANSGRIPQAVQEYKLGEQTDVGTDDLSKAAKAALDAAPDKKKP
jgi:protein O-mannosyl-transferase